jgi:hypothetical protein
MRLGSYSLHADANNFSYWFDRIVCVDISTYVVKKLVDKVYANNNDC